MKSKIIAIITMGVITACSVTKKMAGTGILIPFGHGSVIQLPPHSRKIIPEELAIENKKYQEAPFNAMENMYLADNILIGYLNVWNVKPTDDDFETIKKGIIDASSQFAKPKTRFERKIDVLYVKGNQVFIWRRKMETELNVTFFCKDKNNKLTFTGAVQGIANDSTKIDNDVAYILKNVKFGKE